MKLTKNVLSKLEHLLGCAGYRVRYEKGQFRGGYCVLEDQHLVMINKFFPLESRINLLLEVMNQTEFEDVELDDEEKRMLKQFRKFLATRNQQEADSNLFSSTQASQTVS